MYRSTQKYSRRRSKKPLLLLGLIVLAIGAGILLYISRTSDDKKPAQESTNTTKQEVTSDSDETSDQPPEPQQQVQKPVETNWPVTYTTEEAASLTVVVNKKHKLPSDYAPVLETVAGSDMRTEAAQAMQELLNAAQKDGVPMKIVSGYRSYQTQVTTYQYWVDQQGKTQADRSSARAGHSEHQTGLAADLGMPDGSCELLICFGETPQGIWLAEHAPEYGFIIRYESDTEAITGYQYEPWHIRYLGTETAKAVVASGKTLDEYYDVEAGDYAE